MKINLILSHNMRRIRLGQGLSSTRLAERMKVSRSTVTRIEQLHLMPSLGMVEMIADALRQDPIRLFEIPAGHIEGCAGHGACSCKYEAYMVALKSGE